MSTSYRLKLLHAIDQLPDNLRPDYKDALTKHRFNLEIYVPKNSFNKRTIQNKNYLRNKLVAFNDNLQEEKEMLTALKHETDEFSKEYSNITKENDNSIGTSRFILTYANAIAEYKERGYNEDKLFPKKNIFERSMLLEDTKDYDLLIENGDPKTIKKENQFIQKFSSILRLNKGDFTKNTSTRQSQQLDALPLIPRTLEAIKRENLLLKYDVFQTERSVNNMTIGYDSGLGSMNTSRTGYENQVKTKKKNIIKSIEERVQQSERGDQEEIFLSSKGMKNISRNTNGTINANKKTNITIKHVNAYSSTMNNTINTNRSPKQKTKGEKSSGIASSLKKKDGNNGVPTVIKAHVTKARQGIDLEKLYDELSKGKNDFEGKKIKNYMMKYKKKKIEPVK